ncbi:MAG: GNAT family N-acetyltransferase [bacterium]
MCYELCKEEKVVLKDKEFTLSSLAINDTKYLKDFLNSLIEENTPIIKNQKLNIFQERKWLKNKILSINNKKTYFLVAFYQNKVAGTIEVIKYFNRMSHLASLGIAVSKDFINLCLGKFLINKIISICKEYEDIKSLILEVFQNNSIEINLYKKIGFKEVTRLPKRAYYKNQYIDIIIMDYYL